jgi:hypothetical protein
VLPWHAAEACAPSAVAPTPLVPAHRPSVPAVQVVLEAALLVPPGATAFAVPWVRVAHPVPAQVAVTSTRSFAAKPLVPAWQLPAVAQVAVALPRTVLAPAAVVVEVARVAQPASLPSSQVAVTNAAVVANRVAGVLPVPSVTCEPAPISATHAVVPSQPVAPVAVLRLWRPFGPAVASTVAVRAPTQPASGHTSCEEA